MYLYVEGFTLASGAYKRGRHNPRVRRLASDAALCRLCRGWLRLLGVVGMPMKPRDKKGMRVSTKASVLQTLVSLANQARKWVTAALLHKRS